MLLGGDLLRLTLVALATSTDGLSSDIFVALAFEIQPKELDPFGQKLISSALVSPWGISIHSTFLNFKINYYFMCEYYLDCLYLFIFVIFVVIVALPSTKSPRTTSPTVPESTSNVTGASEFFNSSNSLMMEII